ncbi:probable terpene synthase 2 isoform X2 [Vigna radiata var. radiata]|uniref:Probable terpene synthase 2 isoform X2 n=1 Tax=Vigna radiata var. radiata TaxID=3916 RepID=A0A1S3T7L1_VIGRR|nr:probable terpene synthase 2 isoform X2 [Vigna radiata var. radiata]
MYNGGLSLPISATGAKPPFTRPTANFHPSVWGDRFLSYVPSSAESDSRIQQAKLLKEHVRKRLVSSIDDNNFSFKLNFIDAVQRLGVSYHFDHEIDSALCQVYDISTKDNNIIAHKNDDLYHTALNFRLLRQHGYRISSSVFFKFEDQTGKFKECLADDIEGMLSLYEAAQLRCRGEDVLEEAHNFSLEHLTKFITTQLSCSLVARVQHTLRQSLRRGLPRLETTYFVSFYEKYPSHDEKLITFAKLDFNKLQELHLKELNNITKWWYKDLDVSSNLPFTRDRIVECYFWALGVYFEPQHSRWITAKLAALTTIVDDIYDAYGTIEELELFTNAIDRWDIRCLVDLPKYMQLCYKAILDVCEEIDKEMRKQGKVYCIKYVTKEIKRLVQAQMVEARWCHSNHVPTVEEYMQVRTISSGYPLLITSSFLGMEDTTEEILLWATNEPVIIVASTVLLRIKDDIVGDEFEQERQHVVSSIQCYMKEYKISRKCVIEELHKLVENAWKDINDACLAPIQVPIKFLMRAINFARMVDVVFKDEDIFTNAEGIMKDHIEALLVKKMFV